MVRSPATPHRSAGDGARRHERRAGRCQPSRAGGQQSLAETFNNSQYLADFRQLAASQTRGCIVLERPDLLHELNVIHDVKDTTARKTAAAELLAMTPRSSQYNTANEIPEKSWAYRFAKRHFFNDFGAYSNPRNPLENTTLVSTEIE